MRKTRTRSAYCAVLAMLLACAMETGSTEPDVTMATEAIRHPDENEVDGEPGLVELVRPTGGGFCTGTMIGPRLLLTAAHCVDSLASTSLTVKYFEPGRDASNPRLLGTFPFNIFLNPGHVPSSGGGVSNDFADRDSAILELADSTPRFPGTDYRDYRRIYQDFGNRLPDHLDLYGRGVATISGGGSGTLRMGRFEVANVRDYRIALHQTEEKGICIGDSGGPWVARDSALVACVQSSARLDSGTCGQDDGFFDPSKARCARTVWSNVGALVTANTDAPVYSFNDGTYDYTRFFDIPFINEVDGEGLDRGPATALAMTVI